MFFKKKKPVPAEPLEDLKADDQHTKTYYLGGDDKDDDSSPPSSSPESGGSEASEAAPALKTDQAGETAEKAAAEEPEASPKQSEPEPSLKAAAPAEPEPAAPKAEAPKTPPAPAPQATPAPAPKSQVLQDMQEAGLTLEEAVESSIEIDKKKDKKTGKRRGVENLATVARFRWYVLLILAFASVLAWAVEAQYSDRPYKWLAWAFFGGSVLLGGLSYKVFRIPTRAGLATLIWSGSYFVSALYGPHSQVFGNIPTALVWSGLLSLIMLWVGVAIWRKIGRFRVVDIILSIIVIYAALGPVWALVDNIMAGAALNLSFEVLGASPKFITDVLANHWYLWPMTVTLAFVLPLAAFFSLWDQCSALRRRGARHGGNIFLAAAFIGLIPYGFLSFDKAVEAEPQWAEQIRSICPIAAAAGSKSPAPPALIAPQTSTDWPEPAIETNESLPNEAADTDKPLFEAPARLESDAPAEAPAASPDESARPDAVPAEPVTAEKEAPSEAVLPSPAAVSEMEDRLKTAEERLNQALERIDELEKQLRELRTVPEIEEVPSLPPEADAGFQAGEPAPEERAAVSDILSKSSGEPFNSGLPLPEGFLMV